MEFAQAMAHLGMEEAQVGRLLSIVGAAPIKRESEDRRARFARGGVMRLVHGFISVLALTPDVDVAEFAEPLRNSQRGDADPAALTPLTSLPHFFR